MLLGLEIRLPLDVKYRLPAGTYTRRDYPSEVRTTLTDAYELSPKRLHLAHKRQNNYYDRRTCVFLSCQFGLAVVQISRK